jgi:lytic murein transglycosylase
MDEASMRHVALTPHAFATKARYAAFTALAFTALTVAALSLAGAPARAAQCEPPGGFDVWLDAFKRDAAAAGISQKTIASAFVGITPDPKVLGYDRNQKHFQQTFEQFSTRMISASRLNKGGQMLLKHASVLSRIEAEYGVQGPVLVAIWGLETDYGANIGSMSTLRSLATLAHDCRRTDLFQGELLNALRIVDRGDLTPGEMKGAWAGELGQTQFLPTSYIKYAVDFDGDGKRDLLHSPADVLASTANYLKNYGWKPGQGWSPDEPNYEALLGWNKAQIYTKTVAAFAKRLNGAQ